MEMVLNLLLDGVDELLKGVFMIDIRICIIGKHKIPRICNGRKWVAYVSNN